MFLAYSGQCRRLFKEFGIKRSGRAPLWTAPVGLTQKTQEDVNTMLNLCWARVVDDGPTLNQHY